MSTELLFTSRDRKSKYKDPRSSLILANLYDEILRGHAGRDTLPLNRSQRDVEIYDNTELQINSHSRVSECSDPVHLSRSLNISMCESVASRGLKHSFQDH